MAIIDKFKQFLHREVRIIVTGREHSITGNLLSVDNDGLKVSGYGMKDMFIPMDKVILIEDIRR